MPIYEYLCNSCNKKFEKLVLRKGQEINCPQCKTNGVKRLMSACNFGSSDGSVSSASTSNCASCSAPSCSSCGGH